MTYTAASIPTRTPLHPTTPDLDAELQVAREHARRLTAIYGADAPDVAVAWEVVEELLTAKAKRRQQAPTAFAQYCAAHPDAEECRIYDV